MSDPRTVKMAETLVNYSVAVMPGEKVLLTGSLPAMPLIKETYRQIVRAGGHPLIQLIDDSFSEILLSEGNDEQLGYVHEPARSIVETYDCVINARGTSNTRMLSGSNPDRQRKLQQAMSQLMGIYMKRAAENELRWVSTMYPTNAHAQEADMSLTEFEDFVYGACFADRPDPIAEWRTVSKSQQRLVDWLDSKDQFVIKGPDVDLTLSVKDRIFINDDGHYNMPSGEIFTGPVEQSVNGWVNFSYPAIFSGREVSGIRLVFEQGKVVEAAADKNEAFLLEMLETDPGARYLGEFAIGTNRGIQQFTKSILYDEKIAGTIHMALGRGYTETGSKNDSAIHWDMICDMRGGGTIHVDGTLFYDSGSFKI
jgi:aminopeptidase